MNMFLHELRVYRKSILIWALSMAGLAALFISMFSSMLGEIDAYKNVLSSMPEAMRKALGIYVDSIATLEGYYSFVFVYIILCGAIQAMSLGTGILSKEITGKTAEFLMTKPVRRSDVLGSKVMAAIVALAITNAIYLVITVAMSLTVDQDFNMKVFLLISLSMFFVQLMFLALGLLVSVALGKVQSVISISISTVFGFFIVSAIGSLLEDKAMRYFSPFKYFDTAYIIRHAAYEVPYTIGAVVFVVAVISLSFFIFLQKDIHAV
ncbi:ABC transporter permease [Bacillus sp. FJAT-18017]|uniref:ABC transporter permease subunit n=1 Tax=Bacillus sp. FJAT-18017 TaxID=1705566 RepID=UPI0006AE3248|nr:ABC transporter permease subunit [Bacillus sp. FJAT-18017]ALC92186.1 ABC transporter permease [Bacillus sp. FJAT-18017]